MNAVCQAQVVCDGSRAVHTHHRKLRSQGGKNDPANELKVCLDCHRHIHLNPAESFANGLLVHSWDDPATVEFVPAAAECHPTYQQGEPRPVSGPPTAAGPGTFGFTADQFGRDGVTS